MIAYYSKVSFVEDLTRSRGLHPGGVLCPLLQLPRPSLTFLAQYSDRLFKRESTNKGPLCVEFMTRGWLVGPAHGSLLFFGRSPKIH